jgi:hypothetical protein
MMQLRSYPDQEAASRWLLETPLDKRPSATTSLLMEMFNLSAKQAVAAIRHANAVRYGIQPYGGADASS